MFVERTKMILIDKVEVILRKNQTDLIKIYTPFFSPSGNSNLILDFCTPYNTGESYVRQYFYIEPEIINYR